MAFVWAAATDSQILDLSKSVSQTNRSDSYLASPNRFYKMNCHAGESGTSDFGDSRDSAASRKRKRFVFSFCPCFQSELQPNCHRSPHPSEPPQPLISRLSRAIHPATDTLTSRRCSPRPEMIRLGAAPGTKAVCLLPFLLDLAGSRPWRLVVSCCSPVRSR